MSNGRQQEIKIIINWQLLFLSLNPKFATNWLQGAIIDWVLSSVKGYITRTMTMVFEEVWEKKTFRNVWIKGNPSRRKLCFLQWSTTFVRATFAAAEITNSVLLSPRIRAQVSKTKSVCCFSLNVSRTICENPLIPRMMPKCLYMYSKMNK